MIENGLQWHIINNIEGDTKIYNDKRYHFSRLNYVHHKNNKKYMLETAERFYKVLKSNYNVIFLYMECNDLLVDKLVYLKNIIETKYPNLNFKIVAATSFSTWNDEIHNIKINDRLDTYYCNSPEPFYGNKLNDNVFYTKLFNTIIPYKLDIKKID